MRHSQIFYVRFFQLFLMATLQTIIYLIIKRQYTRTSILTVLYKILPNSCPLKTHYINGRFYFGSRIDSLRIKKVRILELLERTPDQVVWKVSKGLILSSEETS